MSDHKLHQTTITELLAKIGIVKSDLDMLADYCGYDNAAPGPDRRLVDLANALMEFARD